MIGLRHILSTALFCGLLIGCGSIKLIDIPKSTAALQLTAAQQQEIHPKLKLVRDIVVDYNFEKKQLETDYQVYRATVPRRQSGGLEGQLRNSQRHRSWHDMRTKIRKFLTQRRMFLREIEKLMKEVTAALTPEQRAALTELKLPELQLPRMLKQHSRMDLRTLPEHSSDGLNRF